MIDIDLFRKNPEIFREEIKKRNMKINIDEDLEFDAARRKLISAVDELRALTVSYTHLDVYKRQPKKAFKSIK